jgi:hypothetical protein
MIEGLRNYGSGSFLKKGNVQLNEEAKLLESTLNSTLSLQLENVCGGSEDVSSTDSEHVDQDCWWA